MSKKEKPFNKVLFICIFSLSLFCLYIITESSRNYRNPKNFKTEHCFYPNKSGLKSVGQYMVMNIIEKKDGDIPQTMSAFGDERVYYSPAEMVGMEKTAGLAHYYYNPDALSMKDHSIAPMIVYPYFQRYSQQLQWNVLFADGHVEYIDNIEELHELLQNLESNEVSK